MVIKAKKVKKDGHRFMGKLMMNQAVYGPNVKELKSDKKVIVEVMTLKEARTFSHPCMKMACAIPYDESKTREENLAYLRKLNSYGIIRHCSLVGTAQEASRPTRRESGVKEAIKRMAVRAYQADMTRLLGSGFRVALHGPATVMGFGLEQSTGPDGIPVITIITEDGRMPRYIIENVSRKDWEKRKKGGGRSDGGGGGDDVHGNKLLKEPLKDVMLIDCMKDVDKELTAGRHVEFLTWATRKGSRTKEFNNSHLLTCLFFYVWVNKLYKDPGFYNQRKAFFAYCEERLGKDFGMKGYRSFYEKVENLQSGRQRFDECIKGTVVPSREKEVGRVELYFWLVLYNKALPFFKQALTPAGKA